MLVFMSASISSSDRIRLFQLPLNKTGIFDGIETDCTNVTQCGANTQLEG